MEAHPTYANNPDCRDGKHDSCSGEGWDLTADMPCPCHCECHYGPDPDATCISCGHFFNKEFPGQVACSVSCEILLAYDEATLNAPPPGLGGF